MSGRVRADEAAPPPPAITLPRSLDGWATLIITLAGLGWTLYEGYYPVALVLLPMAYQQLQINSKLAAALSAAFSAYAGARHAVQNTETLKEAVRDIQDNPAQPGTPGWMERHAAPPGGGRPPDG